MVGNILAVLFLAGSIALLGTRTQTPKAPIKPEELTPWNHQLGKTNSLKANGNRDMSMWTERIRRLAIQSNREQWIHETHTMTGSANGHVEARLTATKMDL